MVSGGRNAGAKFSEDVTIRGDQTVTTSNDPPYRSENVLEEEKAVANVHLTWRSWIVVFVASFAQLAQVFVVAGTAQNITFIARDIGDPGLAAWIIQAPLLIQSVLTPTVSRLSDVLDRRWLVTVPPFVAFVGAVVSATASSMATLIGGGILIGVTLSTIGIVQAIASEVLPLKYRAIANGAGFIGSGIGGVVGTLGAGKVTSLSDNGWRNIFWIQAALHGATCLGLLVAYHPSRPSDYPRMSPKEYIWAIDPVGSVTFIIGTTLALLALDWVNVYGWADAMVIAPLCIGLISLIAFGVYEWKGRDDGIMTHAFFKKSPNFALATFALAVDGWIFYSAVNTVVPQLTLNLGFESNAWSISVRQLSSSLTTLVACLPITWYATRFKDMRTPLLVTFVIFLAATICYALISPDLDAAQIGYNVLIAVGQAGPLTLLVAVIQLAAPHEHLSTATALAFSSRAIGGSFGSAVLTAIVNGKLSSDYAKRVGNAAVDAGLPETSVEALITNLQLGDMESLNTIPGISDAVIEQAVSASHWVYAHAYRLAWSSIVPFVVVAIICVIFLRDVKPLMTNKIEASVEPEASQNRQRV